MEGTHGQRSARQRRDGHVEVVDYHLVRVGARVRVRVRVRARVRARVKGER